MEYFRGVTKSTSNPNRRGYMQVGPDGRLHMFLLFEEPAKLEYGKKYPARLGLAPALTSLEWADALTYMQHIINVQERLIGSVIVQGRSHCIDFTKIWNENELIDDMLKAWLKPVLEVKVSNVGQQINQMRITNPEFFMHALTNEDRRYDYAYTIYLVSE